MNLLSDGWLFCGTVLLALEGARTAFENSTMSNGTAFENIITISNDNNNSLPMKVLVSCFIARIGNSVNRCRAWEMWHKCGVTAKMVHILFQARKDYVQDRKTV